MKLFITFFILLAGCLPAFSADFWEPLDGPYGGEISGAVQTDNYLFVYNSYAVKRSPDDGKTWEPVLPEKSLNIVERLEFTGGKKLYLYSKAMDTSRTYTVYSSEDEGQSWNMIQNDGVFQYFTDNYQYSFDFIDIRVKAINDTTVFTYRTNAMYPTKFLVDKNENVYLVGSNSVLISTNQCKSFTKIIDVANCFKIDDSGNLYYSSNDSGKSSISYSNDMGKNWQTININFEINSFTPMNHDVIYLRRANMSYLLEDFNPTKITIITDPKKDTSYFENILTTRTKIITQARYNQNSITSDKYLQNLEVLKINFGKLDVLLGGTKLLLTGKSNISYLKDNGFINLNSKFHAEYYDNIFISKRDYFWVTFVGLAAPDANFSPNYGDTTFIHYWPYCPHVIADNSKNEVFALVWNGNSLAKLNDSLYFKKIPDIYYPGDNMYFNNNDELIIVSNYMGHKYIKDTLRIFKLEMSDYSELFTKYLPLNGKFIKSIISENGYLYFLTDTLLYRSNDEGSTISQVLDGGQTGKRFRDLITVKNTIFIATNSGVLTSEDFGNTWYDNNSGLKSFDCLTLAKLADNSLYVGLNSDVVYRSTIATKVDENPRTEIQSDFFIQPNPATDFIEISVGARHALTNSDIRIFNVFGEIVSTSVCYADTSASGGQKIDVSGLPSGVYFVRIGDKVRKFVKI